MNEFDAFPASLNNLKAIEELRFHGNCITELPSCEVRTRQGTGGFRCLSLCSVISRRENEGGEVQTPILWVGDTSLESLNSDYKILITHS